MIYLCKNAIRQRGLSSVEFAIVSVVLFTLVFGVIEVARAFFIWETLTEATRRGARIAAVCPMNHSAIANIAVLNNPGGGNASTVVSGLTTNDIVVSYLNSTGGGAGNFNDVRYVRVAIAPSFQFQFSIPFISALITAPPLQTTLPRESLGVVPGLGSQCFGTAN